jgi:hypothetical protein
MICGVYDFVGSYFRSAASPSKPSRTLLDNGTSNSLPRCPSGLSSDEQKRAEMVAASIATVSQVTPQDVRFCSRNDILQCAQLLGVGSGNGGGTTSSSMKQEETSSSHLGPFLQQMLQQNKFQDVLHETQPEVLLAAIRVIQEIQENGDEHQLHSGGGAAPSATTLFSPPEVRCVSALLFEHPMWRCHVLPHIDASSLETLFGRKL